MIIQANVGSKSRLMTPLIIQANVGSKSRFMAPLIIQANVGSKSRLMTPLTHRCKINFHQNIIVKQLYLLYIHVYFFGSVFLMRQILQNVLDH